MLGNPKLLIVFLSALIVAYGLLGGLLDRVAARDIYGHLSIFTDVLRKLKNEYVEQPNMELALTGALQGMVEALDPYSSFVSATTFGELSQQASAPASPGLVVAKRFGYILVVAVVPNSQAARAGLRTGDVLESIDGLGTSTMSLWEATARLKGDEGSSVKVRLIRARRPEPAEITLERQIIVQQRVKSQVVEEGIGVLEIPSFESGAAEAIAAQLKMLGSSAAKGLVLDLRDNAFGGIDEAVRAADFFLPAGKPIISRRDRRGDSADLAAKDVNVASTPSVVILVDAGTSGAAEIFAAALRDNDVAQVLGEKTNGRGGEYQEFQLADGSLLVLATKLYYRFSGQPIQGESVRTSGIAPDRRSPNNTFVSNFYFDNVTDNVDDRRGDEFYIRLESAIEQQQMLDAIAAIREALEKAA